MVEQDSAKTAPQAITELKIQQECAEFVHNSACVLLFFEKHPCGLFGLSERVARVFLIDAHFLIWKRRKSSKILRKGLIIIIPISKEEAMFIRSKRKHLRIPKTTNGRYYLVEDRDVLRLLYNYRNGKYNNGAKK